MGGFARPALEDAGLVLVVRRVAVVQLVPAAQQRGRLYEAQGQPLGGEPQVPRPGRLLLRQGASGEVLQEPDALGPAETSEEDLLQVRVL
ncbi:hypothetical protein ACFSNO_06150 [Streptomyces cirratus]